MLDDAGRSGSASDASTRRTPDRGRACNDLTDLATRPIAKANSHLRGAILRGIERRAPDDFRSAADAHDYLLKRRFHWC